MAIPISDKICNSGSAPLHWGSRNNGNVIKTFINIVHSIREFFYPK